MAETATLGIVRVARRQGEHAASEAAQTLISPAIPSQPFVKPQSHLSAEADYLRFVRHSTATPKSGLLGTQDGSISDSAMMFSSRFAFSRVTLREELPLDQPWSPVVRGHNRPEGSQISERRLRRSGSQGPVAGFRREDYVENESAR